MPVVIAPERPDTPDASTLIAELDSQLDSLYPNESRHGYSVGKLIDQGVAFFVLRDDGVPVGCGGVQIFGGRYGEVKRMYVRDAFRGRGHAKSILEHLENYTLEQGVELLRLETGIHQQAAISLYEGAGFKPIPPFGEYVDDPNSRCYEKVLR
jgi:GNAT superfamily N-acetyltransferase